MVNGGGGGRVLYSFTMHVKVSLGNYSASLKHISATIFIRTCTSFAAPPRGCYKVEEPSAAHSKNCLLAVVRRNFLQLHYRRHSRCNRTDWAAKKLLVGFGGPSLRYEDELEYRPPPPPPLTTTRNPQYDFAGSGHIIHSPGASKTFKKFPGRNLHECKNITIIR